LTDKRAAIAIALAFFFGWLAILAAGADHPLPPRFPALILFDLAAAFVVYRRVPVYAQRARARRPKRWLLALLEGALAGLIAAGLALVLSGILSVDDQTSMQRPAPAVLIFVAVVAAVGASNALLIFALSAASASYTDQTRKETPK
jgi:membrane protease YdiL (CAAX protease family)